MRRSALVLPIAAGVVPEARERRGLLEVEGDRHGNRTVGAGFAAPAPSSPRRPPA